MTYEFTGKTEEEAIENAINELGLERDAFDVEILEKSKGIFRKGPVKIKVYIDEEMPEKEETGSESYEITEPELEMVEFLKNIIEKMGIAATLEINKSEENKVYINIESDMTNLLIGRKGATLDALQLLANVFISKKKEDLKVVVDIENYRGRREQSLQDLALKTARYVRKTKTSHLLEPMNPFERRIIHSALQDSAKATTTSEGEDPNRHVVIIPKNVRVQQSQAGGSDFKKKGAPKFKSFGYKRGF